MSAERGQLSLDRDPLKEHLHPVNEKIFAVGWSMRSNEDIIRSIAAGEPSFVSVAVVRKKKDGGISSGMIAPFAFHYRGTEPVDIGTILNGVRTISTLQSVPGAQPHDTLLSEETYPFSIPGKVDNERNIRLAAFPVTTHKLLHGHLLTTDDKKYDELLELSRADFELSLTGEEVVVNDHGDRRPILESMRITDIDGNESQRAQNELLSQLGSFLENREADIALKIAQKMGFPDVDGFIGALKDPAKRPGPVEITNTLNSVRLERFTEGYRRREREKLGDEAVETYRGAQTVDDRSRALFDAWRDGMKGVDVIHISQLAAKTGIPPDTETTVAFENFAGFWKSIVEEAAGPAADRSTVGSIYETERNIHNRVMKRLARLDVIRELPMRSRLKKRNQGPMSKKKALRYVKEAWRVTVDSRKEIANDIKISDATLLAAPLGTVPQERQETNLSLIPHLVSEAEQSGDPVVRQQALLQLALFTQALIYRKDFALSLKGHEKISVALKNIFRQVNPTRSFIIEDHDPKPLYEFNPEIPGTDGETDGIEVFFDIKGLKQWANARRKYFQKSDINDGYNINLILVDNEDNDTEIPFTPDRVLKRYEKMQRTKTALIRRFRDQFPQYGIEFDEKDTAQFLHRYLSGDPDFGLEQITAGSRAGSIGNGLLRDKIKVTMTAPNGRKSISEIDLYMYPRISSDLEAVGFRSWSSKRSDDREGAESYAVRRVLDPITDELTGLPSFFDLIFAPSLSDDESLIRVKRRSAAGGR